MRQLFITSLIVLLTLSLSAQQNWYLGVAASNTQPAYPFGKFLGLFKDALHPGIELSYGHNFSQKKKHDWFYEFQLGYFYHRYVQHGIPVSIDFGYRYHVSSSFSLETSVGAGFMRSIPETEVFIQTSNVEYAKKKVQGRDQAISTYELGGSYYLNKKGDPQWRIFANYEQRIQFPFIKSYVPILPYNSFKIGISKALGTDKLKQAHKIKKYMSPVDRLLIKKNRYPQ
jgi:hypothetical protein